MNLDSNNGIKGSVVDVFYARKATRHSEAPTLREVQLYRGEAIAPIWFLQRCLNRQIYA